MGVRGFTQHFQSVTVGAVLTTDETGDGLKAVVEETEARDV
jgi:hypothetical protein